MKLLNAILIVLFLACVSYSQTNEHKPGKTETSNSIDREEHDTTRDAKRVTVLPDFASPIATSNVPGYRDTTITCTIDSAASLSSVINFGNRRPKLIFCPAVWTTANLSIKVSKDGSTWGNLYVDDIEFTLVAGAGIAINCNPRAFIGIQYMQIRSGTAATPVNQGARRTLSIVAGNY